MSPILVRPVREQLEHDRVIRALQAKLKRKFDVAVNIGGENVAPVKAEKNVLFPDLVLSESRRGAGGGTVEVETAESVNNLEAMAQWAPLARAKVPFHLYVPAGSVDMARRLCASLQIPVDEIWSYFPLGTQYRFTLVHRTQAARPGAARRAPKASARRPTPAARARAPRRRPGARHAKARPKTGRATVPGRAAAAKAGKRERTAAKPARTRKR